MGGGAGGRLRMVEDGGVARRRRGGEATGRTGALRPPALNRIVPCSQQLTRIPGGRPGQEARRAMLRRVCCLGPFDAFRLEMSLSVRGQDGAGRRRGKGRTEGPPPIVSPVDASCKPSARASRASRPGPLLSRPRLPICRRPGPRGASCGADARLPLWAVGRRKARNGAQHATCPGRPAGPRSYPVGKRGVERRGSGAGGRAGGGGGGAGRRRGRGKQWGGLKAPVPLSPPWPPAAS